MPTILFPHGNPCLDRVSKVTTFNRNFSGVLTSITSPDGQVTSVGVDSNGYLSYVTNPNSETYTLGYHGSQGLLYTFHKQLTQITKPSDAYVSLDYDPTTDPLNRRVGKSVNGVLQKRWI